MRKIIFIIILLCAILLCFQCKKSQEFRIYRFIDRLTENNIVSSPLMEPDGEKNMAHDILYDHGIGENPFNIKKKLVIGQDSFNALFSPPKTVFSFKVSIPEDSEFCYGYGLLAHDPDSNSEVRFEVILKSGQVETLLLEDELIETDAGSLIDQTFDLKGFSGKQVEIFLKTTSLNERSDGENILSFWKNPVIYRKSEIISEGQEKRPNIILISIDTLRADHLSCYGYSKPTSPNIDAFTRDSVQFTSCFSQASYTLTSHVSLFTSLFPNKHKVLYLGQKLSAAIPTLADHLRSSGYFTQAFTGGGQVSATFGFAKGFDIYHENSKEILQDDPAAGLFEKSVEWLRLNKDKPFFLFMHTYQTHDPYTPPQELTEMFLQREPELKNINIGSMRRKGIPLNFTDDQVENIKALYDAEIRFTDQVFFGPLIEELKRLNLYDKTLIIFTSDHGEEFLDHNGWLHNHSLYNELIKVPLIIKFPYSQYKGRIVGQMIRMIDIMPTILERVESPLLSSSMDGRSLLSYLRRGEKQDRVFFSEIMLPLSLNKLNKLFIRKIATNNGNLKLVCSKRYPVEQYPINKTLPLDRIELYDLAGDPFEKRNLVENMKDAADDLIQKVIDYYIHQGKGNELPEESDINQELQEQLRALGYIK